MKRRRRHHIPDHIFALRDQYVTVAGELLSVAIEHDRDPRKIDHVWVTVQAGEFGRVQIALNTLSRQARALDLDARVRVGLITAEWTELPPAGVRLAPGLDYDSLAVLQPVSYDAYEQRTLEEMLVRKVRRAILIEAWGEFYMRAHIGIHQVHSRRASEAVPRMITGRDGAVRLYFANPKISEMLLFKFAGQL